MAKRVVTFGEIMLRHARLVVEWHGDETGLRQFRKHATWYIAGWPVGRTIRQRVGQLNQLADVERLVGGFTPQVSFPPEAARLVRSHRNGPRRVALPAGWLDEHEIGGPLAAGAEQVASGG